VKHYSESRKLAFIRNTLLSIIDFFHPLVRKWIPIQTFRYIACGGSVTVLGLLIYFLSYNFLFKTELVAVGPFQMTRYIAAYVISFCVSFPIGFFLSKFVVFQESHLAGRVQLFRYATLQGINIGLNYCLLHFFAGWCGFWATPSQTLTTAIIAFFSYFFQRHISFRTKKDPAIIGIPAIEEEKA
jgi:putative flippase GtrA